ncbi:MAG: DNA phosphorothioation system sulfurtransferase DndC [Bacteroidetes bacterium]|nr:DNA phosphorothioation system sulfurtransferase DndC [Bacteroidota bacterium]
MSKRINYIISELSDQYLIDDDSQRPWIIGFSGGKDSTALLQLVWLALKKIPHELRSRKIYVVCNDTMVENPVVADYVDSVLKMIGQAAVEQGLPIEVQKTIPRLEDAFWVNILGRGYPVPNNAFRWCTDKMKIRPTSRFITEQVVENGEAIILIGTRSAESASRAQSIKKHEIKGKRLTKHPHQHNTYVYSPIKDLLLEEVWYIINTMTSPWGADNSKLFQIYTDASADDYECPTMVTDKSHSSCGQSRFGCWTCTVVKEDKSMSAMVSKGYPWLKPLLDLRSQMIENRNESDNRLPTRRNGQLAISEDGIHQGNYTQKYRAELLEQVLIAQQEVQKERPDLHLITNQELIAIQVLWHKDLCFEFRVSEIYNRVFNKELDMKKFNEKMQKEVDLLKSVCNDKPSDFDLIQELLIMQKNKALLNRKRGLKDDMERVIEKYLKKSS